MIANIRSASHANERPCLVLMDLAGSKIRTRSVLTPGTRPSTVEATRGRGPHSYGESDEKYQELFDFAAEVRGSSKGETSSETQPSTPQVRS